MFVYKPTFMTKAIVHSKPYPGAVNKITVTISANTNLHKGTRIAIHNVVGAIATSGDMTLIGASKSYFESLDGTAEKGTWYDCQKALILKVKTDLGCNGEKYVVSFEVQNPVEPQLCAGVLVNASGINNNPCIDPNGPATVDIYQDNTALVPQVWNGFLMDADTTSVPTDIYGAVGEDACPMTVWPAAFLIKDIGQDNEHPCGLNTITVTMSTNVPLYSSITYPGREPIKTDVIISRIQNAIQDDTQPDGTKSIALASQTTVEQCSGTSAAVTLFSDLLGNASKASWSSQLQAKESTLTVRMTSDDCCVPGPTSKMYIFSFTVYNPSMPQNPIFPVSISASGIPIQVSAMRHDVGNFSPMYVKNGALEIKTIQQSSHYPCVDNTVAVTLTLNVNLYKRCKPMITLTGLSNVTLEHSISIVSNPNTTSNATYNTTVYDRSVTWAGSSKVGTGTWHGDSSTGVLTINATDVEVTAGEIMWFKFTIKNPFEAVSPMFDHFVAIQQIGLDQTRLTHPVDSKLVPITVIDPIFKIASIVQSTPYPAALNTITVTLESNVKLPGACDVKITVSGLEGACVESANNIVQLEGTGADTFRFSLTNSTAESKAAWNADAKSVAFYTAGTGMEADTKYTFQFKVRNPTTGQTSPVITIESSGIVITPRSMEKNPNSMVPPGVFLGLAKEAEPIEVRGAVIAAAFVKMKIGQSSAGAGETNEITVTIQTNVPLTASSPATTVTIKSLTGAVASAGDMTVAVTKPSLGEYGGSFSGKWKTTERAMVLTVSGADTVPGKDYVVRFSIVNPRQAQSSPTIIIESSGIVIQPKAMTSPDAVASPDSAPMYVNGPELQDVYTWQSESTAWPGHTNTIFVRFTPTVDLIPKIDKRLAIVIGGLKGVAGLMDGRVVIAAADAGNFSACVVHASNCSLANSSQWEMHNSEGRWSSGARTLELSVANILTKNKPVEISLTFVNSLVGQDPPAITVAMTSDFEDFDIAPVVATPLAAYKGTDQEALLIHPSAAFSVMKISQSTSAPGATNTITATFKPQFALTGAKNATITISGLKGSATPDKPINLLNADATFNSVAAWDSRSGTLVLKVAPGQTVSKDSDTVIIFDLVNPKYPQSGPAVVEIAANGDVPISAAAMLMDSGDNSPLKVVASDFTTAAIGTSTTAPGAWNTVKVTLKPNVLLSKTRNSIITIDGLSGSLTEDTRSLPFTMESGSAATFISPSGSFSLGFSTQCTFSDNGVVFGTELDESEDPTGSMLFFTAGGCKDRWTMISAYNRTTHCATLNATAGNWFDGQAKCTSLGEIKELKVLAGGGAYKNGAFEVESLVGGTGLSGNCTVDEYGVVQTISVLSAGRGYGSDTKIKCSRACQSADVCSATGSAPVMQAEAEVGYTIVHDSGAMSAAEWRRGSGTLKLAVRDELDTSADTVISFKIKNSMTAQQKQPIFVMASGATPIGSEQMIGDVMEISSTSSTITKVCTSPTGPCTATFALPAGKTLYTMSAEIQCNAKATNVGITTGASDTLHKVVQPPVTCVDSCDEYHRLLSDVDVTSDVDGTVLVAKASASGISTDHCGAGDNLKVIFIVSY